MSNRRVVITGMGIFSCLGQGVAAVEDSLRAGRSGVGLSTRRAEMGYRSPLMGMLPSVDPKDVLDRRSRLRYAEHGLYAHIAAQEALAMAAMSPEFLAHNEVGIIMGNDSSAAAVIEGVDTVRAKGTTLLVGSGNVFKAMNSTLSMNLAVSFGLRGVSFSVSAACASSSHAIGLAMTLIRQGIQDRILCGGAQEVGDYSVGSFDGISAFSTRTDAPQQASRPFDSERDGLVPSGGGACVVVESLESALARGANVLAELVGYGVSTGGEHLSAPNVTGPETAMRRALADALLQPAQVSYVNAHATSTKVGDANEATAITNVFGLDGPFVSSTKSMTGHELWMAGASEVVYSLIMMHGGFIAPNINLATPAPEAASLRIPVAATPADVDVVLSNSFGFGGTNSALVFRRFVS